MPELPEVETIRRDLASRLVGKRISVVKVESAKTVAGQPEEFVKTLKGASFTEIDRRGKLLIFHLSRRDSYLLVHLKMTGQLIYLSADGPVFGGHSLASGSLERSVGGALPNKHTRVSIYFSDKSRLFFNDLRRFGYMKTVDGKRLGEIIAGDYGAEPLRPDFTLKYLAAAVSGRKKSIKGVLLDQKLIAGLGNIYADESLFAAGVRPDRPALSLTAVEIKRLYAVVNKIIKAAIAKRGTTFSNYVDSHGHKGNYSACLQVYGRQGLPCRKCGRPLSGAKVAGRHSCFCSYCQK